MNWFQALILGLIQGLTEFLPVSSSGHLMIGRELLGLDIPEDLIFEVTVHCATVLSTIIVFRKPIGRLLSGLFKDLKTLVQGRGDGSRRSGGASAFPNDETDYILKLCVSMIPVFVVGVFFKDFVESIFGSFIVVGFALLVTALLLFFSEKKALCKSAPDSSERNALSYKQAFIIGLGQAVAVIPGLSRSGTTIATGLLSGVRKDTVTQFSFLMVLVPVLGEAFLDVVGGDFGSSSIGLDAILSGFAAAFVSGMFACKAMIAIVRKTGLKWFALYCSVAGIAVIVSQIL